LNPQEFYLWGHQKTLAYAAPVDNEAALHHRIADVCQTITNYPCIFEWMRRPMMGRVEACIESHGGYFEPYNSLIKCFRTYVNMDIFLVLVCGTSAKSLFVPISYTLIIVETVMKPQTVILIRWISLVTLLFYYFRTPFSASRYNADSL
jgi:hypothetical protein